MSQYLRTNLHAVRHGLAGSPIRAVGLMDVDASEDVGPRIGLAPPGFQLAPRHVIFVGYMGGVLVGVEIADVERGFEQDGEKVLLSDGVSSRIGSQ